MSSLIYSRSKKTHILVALFLFSVVAFTIGPYFKQHYENASNNATPIFSAFAQKAEYPHVPSHEHNVNTPDAAPAPVDVPHIPAPVSANTFHKIEHNDKSFQVSTVAYKKNLPIDDNKATVLILSSIGNSHSYGNGRDFNKFLEVIQKIVKVKDSSKYEFSLGIQCNDESEYSNIKSIINSVQEDLYPILSRITLVSAPNLEHQVGLTRENRHDDRLQRVRRRLIAKSRNFLWTTALKHEQYIFFMDADMVSMTDNIVEYFVDSGKDVVVPRVATQGGNPDYDKNSWRGQRTKPSQHQLDLMDSNKWEEWDYTPFDVKDHIYHFETYLQDESAQVHKDDLTYTFPLDSVGGAVLFAKSMVFKQGAIFPTSNLIGTSWDRSEGYDGIETEGLCYLAKPLGFSCWGMPNTVAIHV